MSMTRVGITATRSPLAPPQARGLGTCLLELSRQGAEWLHHGDCVGGDATAHGIARAIDLRVVVHPPAKGEFRAYCEGDELREEKGYWARNRDVVDETDLLVACPKAGTSLKDWRYSGTWYTIKYAHEKEKPVRLVYPDGRVFGGIW